MLDLDTYEKTKPYKMKKTLSILVLSILSFSFSWSQDLENSLLWEISGNGLEHSSYIFGTIHMTCDASLDDKVKVALDHTSLLVLELDMDDPNMNASMMQNMAMKDNQNMQSLLTDEEYAELDAFVKSKFGAPLDAFQTFKPFFLSAMVATKFLDCPVQSFEAELMKVTKEQNEEVLGLESVEDQLSIFDEIPYQVQIDDLMESISDDLAKDKVKFLKITEYYNTSNLAGIKQLTDEDDTQTMSKYKNLLLTNRNKNWISKIENYAKEQPTFFGVGAAHLIGNEGVIQLLRKQGFKVTPVK